MKIHELSDRVRLSGVCSVKLALAHRIASDRATAAATAIAVMVPRDEERFVLIDRTYKSYFRPRLAGDDKSTPPHFHDGAAREGHTGTVFRLFFMPTLRQVEVTQVAN